jgi:hypothetical protein
MMKLPAANPFAAAVYTHRQQKHDIRAILSYHIEHRSRDAECTGEIVHILINNRLLEEKIRLSIVHVPINNQLGRNGCPSGVPFRNNHIAR